MQPTLFQFDWLIYKCSINLKQSINTSKYWELPLLPNCVKFIRVLFAFLFDGDFEEPNFSVVNMN